MAHSPPRSGVGEAHTELRPAPHFHLVPSRRVRYLSAGIFHRLAFPIPTELANELAESYSYLTLKVVINAPASDYLVDRLWFCQEEEPDAGTGGRAGMAGASGSGGLGSCSDGLMSGDETHVDCGGSCPPCPEGSPCLAGADCESNACLDGVCAILTASDHRPARPAP